jgi:hypothetical protein
MSCALATGGVEPSGGLAGVPVLGVFDPDAPGFVIAAGPPVDSGGVVLSLALPPATDAGDETLAPVPAVGGTTAGGVTESDPHAPAPIKQNIAAVSDRSVLGRSARSDMRPRARSF